MPGVVRAVRLARGLVGATTSFVPVSVALRRSIVAAHERAGWTQADAIALVDAFNDALRAAPDDEGASRWLHHWWDHLFDVMYGAVSADLSPRRAFTALCLGAGTRNPLAMPLLLYMGGAARVIVVEPELAGSVPDWRVRWGLQELALHILSGDVTSSHFVRDAAEVASFVDLRALFFAPSVDAALRPETLEVLPAYLEDCRIAPSSVSLVVSRSVLEHVVEVDRCYDALAALLAPGGMMCHHIDLSAHDASDRFAFYYDDPGLGGARRPDGLNGLRLSDHIGALTTRGLDTRVVDRTVLTDYPLDRRRLRERFRRYADDDLLCARAVIVCRRPR